MANAAEGITKFSLVISMLISIIIVIII